MSRTSPLYIFLWLAFLVLISPPTQAQDDAPIKLETRTFAQIPILHEGRIKPLDSFARAYLKTFSGKERGALPWLIEVLFDPARAEQRPVLKVTNPELQTILHLERRKNKLYSYAEISQALGTKQKMILSIIEAKEENWSLQQRELILLQTNMVSLQNLLGSLTPLLPLSITLPNNVPEAFKPYAEKTLTYVDTLAFHNALQDTLKAIIAEKGDDFEIYTDEEKALAHLSFSLSTLKEANKRSTILKVIPMDEQTWISPWIVVQKETPSPLLQHWKALSTAYHTSDVQGWNSATQALQTAIRTHENTHFRPQALRAEYYYNLYNPFYISVLLLLLGGFTLLASLFGKHPFVPKVVYAILLGSLACQITGISLRIFILQRPPVSTLYETILFVSLIVALYAVTICYKDKNALWLWLGTGLGIFLHILGFSNNTGSDSFVMLSAVLNTNFWLTTHVLCITIGYAYCALTSVLAHYALTSEALGKKADHALFKNIHMAALLALFFASIGTVLGGIWADQSWGRFWGWDPKENGALLIVFWLIWIIHGRISGQMRQQAVLCGLSYLSVILALSWFGVNLLGVGLHAYGFTDAALWSLGLFIGMETAFIIWIRSKLMLKDRRAHA